ncbi:MAG: MBL fold metallo-hydrolase [Chloroflexi bacterium]|nr:MBL fold metallo-hydrolase [Chloroflexota bacterium]
MTRVTLWGTRGSLASPGPETARYGGNTSCVEVRGHSGTVLVLDAGTGLRRLGRDLPVGLRRVDILLTHLHMDHIQGLGFFGPLLDPSIDVHIWGPASTTLNLHARLSRYLSPPTFPISLADLERMPELHEVPCSVFEIGEFRISTALVSHPGPTVGYRIQSPDGVVTYLPDHEPALGVRHFPQSKDWTSGYALAAESDLLIHDTQFTQPEYEARIGWGHSSISQAFAFARIAEAKHLITFHHDPDHSDADLDRIMGQAIEQAKPEFGVTTGAEGETFQLGHTATGATGDADAD